MNLRINDKLISQTCCSFFLECDCIGTSRAQAATRCLLELNPDVRGDYIEESAEHIMSHTQDFFNNFTVVITSSLPEKYVNVYISFYTS